MSVVAIVAEYNPFHSGHAYQLVRAKEATGADHALVIMSGDFVQRGSAAIMDKYLRTQMALQGGADCVLELPVWMATGPALDFATGAVRILNALGCVDFLCFGAESADLGQLQEASEIFHKEDPVYQNILKEKLKSSASYATARQAAYEEYTGQNGDFLSEPNNILAISYLQALADLGSEIKPVVIKRQGDYHSSDLQASTPAPVSDMQYASATAIRTKLREAFSSTMAAQKKPIEASTALKMIQPFVPEACYDLYTSCFGQTFPIEDYAYWPMLELRLLEYRDKAAEIYDFPKELANRFEKYALNASSYQELVSSLASANYTNTRIHRGLLHMLLGLREKDVSVWKNTDQALYARVLGFRSDHSQILKDMIQNSSIPVLTKAMEVQEFSKFDGKTIRLSAYEKDLFASNLYRRLQKQAFQLDWKHEYSQKLVKIQE